MFLALHGRIDKTRFIMYILFISQQMSFVHSHVFINSFYTHLNKVIRVGFCAKFIRTKQKYRPYYFIMLNKNGL